MPKRAKGPGLPRRDFLRALAVAPAALAGCAAAGRPGSAASSEGAPDAPARPPPSAAVAAVRGFRLPSDAEPAFVFRAAARPGEPR